MSVKIRLKRMGSKKRPFYRFIATDSRNPRDGRFIETLGYYNPMTEPPDIKIDEAAVIKWMERGAKPSASTESLFRKLGFMQKWNLLKQGVKREDLDRKMSEMRAKGTPPKAPGEKAEVEKEKPEDAGVQEMEKADAKAKPEESSAEQEPSEGKPGEEAEKESKQEDV